MLTLFVITLEFLDVSSTQCNSCPHEHTKFHETAFVIQVILVKLSLHTKIFFKRALPINHPSVHPSTDQTCNRTMESTLIRHFFTRENNQRINDLLNSHGTDTVAIEMPYVTCLTMLLCINYLETGACVM